MLQGYLFIISAATLWGLIGIFSSLAFSQGVDPMEVAFWRAVLTWFCFGTQAVVRKKMRVDKKDLPLLVIFGAFGIALFYVSYQVAVKTAGAAFASVLLYTAPAWVVLGSFFIYREKLTLLKMSAVVLVIFGVYLISMSGGDSGSSVSFGPAAILWGLTAGFCYSLYYTIGKYFSGKYESDTLFLWVLPIGALGIFPFVEFSEKTLLAWVAMVLISVVSTYFANFCHYQALRHLEAGKASIAATLEPVVAAVTAYIFLGEYFSVLGYIGAGLIILAVISTTYNKS